MPRIPLANIPQAPGVGPGPAMIQTPGFKVNMGDVSNQMMQSQQSAAPYVAAAGMDALADGVAGAGNVFGQLSAELARSKNVADIARAEVLMSEAKAAHAQEIANLPETEWAKVWETKYRPQYEKGIQSLNLSTWSRERVEPMMVHFDSRARTDIAYSAHKQTLQRDQQAILNSQQQDLQSGDYAGAMEKTALLIESGHMTPEQGQKLNLSIEEDAKNNAIEAQLNADPDGLIGDIEDGKIEVPDGRKAQLLNQAKQVKRRQVAEADDELDQLVLTGDISTEAEIREWAEARGIPERQILSHLKSLSVVNENTEAGQAAIQSARVNIQADISAYDPASDVDDKAYFSIKDKIRASLPEGLRQEFLTDISAMRREGRKTPEQEVKGNVLSQIRSLKTNGFFGKTDNAKRELAASQKANYFMDQFRAYQKQMGPKLTQAEADAWLATQVNGDVKKAVGERAFSSGSPVATDIIDQYMGARPKTQADLMQEIDAALKLPTE